MACEKYSVVQYSLEDEKFSRGKCKLCSKQKAPQNPNRRRCLSIFRLLPYFYSIFVSSYIGNG